MIFFAGAFFGRPLTLGAVGLFVKVYLFFDHQIHFSYRSIDWKNGKIVFAEVDLKQDRAFTLHANRIKVSLGSKHLEVDQPRIVLFGEPRFKTKSDWLFAAKEGTIVKEGIGDIHFSATRNWPNQIGQFTFEKEGSEWDVEAIREGEEIGVYARFHRFEMGLLQEWIDLQGQIDGQVHLVFEGRQCKRGSAHLDIQEGRYGKAIARVAGRIDWEGKTGFAYLTDGRLRISLAQGSVKGRGGRVEEMKGEFSFASGLGAKWECEGRGFARGEQFSLSCTGRAFLHDSRPHWVESTALCGEAYFSLSGNEEEAGYCFTGDFRQIGSAEGTLIQSFLSLADERFSTIDFQEGQVNISAKLKILTEGRGEWELAGFAEDLVCMQNQVGIKCQEAAGHFSSQNAGDFSLSGASFSIPLAGEKILTGKDWKGEGRIENDAFLASRLEGIVEERNVALAFSGTCEAFQVEAIGQEGKIALTGQWFDACDWSLQAKGELWQGIGFYSPILEKRGEILTFDIRIENPSWDWMRLYGVWDGLKCRFDPDRTHFLGEPIQVGDCICDQEGLSKLQLHALIPLQPFLAAAAICFPETKKWSEVPIAGIASLDFSFSKDEGASFAIDDQNLSWMGKPLSVHLAASEENGAWHLSACQIDQFLVSGMLQNDGSSFRFSKGTVSWNNDLIADFYGAIDASCQCEFQFPFLKVDLSNIHSLAFPVGIPVAGLEGVLEGKGCLSWKGKLEADFDFAAPKLKAASLSWENDGPIHLCYSSEKGLLCRGLSLQAPDKDLRLRIDLLQYDVPRNLWILRHSRIYLSPEVLHLVPFLEKFDLGVGIDLFADIECPSGFSYLSCHVLEGLIPFAGAVRSVRDLSFYFDENDAKLTLQYVHQGCAIGIGASVSFGADLSGRLHFEEISRPLQEGERPLSVDWTYSNETGFVIREIEGRFGGIEASFHALDSVSSLIGSARIHFGVLSELMPARLAELFCDLKMGKGYELKGRLCLDRGQLSFRGLFSGKQIELFGYQLRTLIGQIELSADRVRLYDLKISDSAGIMKIDSIEAKGDGENRWIVSIPRLTLLELRPSLLQKEGRGLEQISAGPLVVRELKIDDFKGVLDDSKTYTATGELTFINSYRRKHTVFDLPSDFLGRIVGLDLELLIPVCGTLRYELKDGLFHLLELKDAYSEANRSEFFLVQQPAPTMDLDGNLHILVNMKQFVLFKFTESFLISINGTLDDAQFHLQKKRRFLGL